VTNNGKTVSPDARIGEADIGEGTRVAEFAVIRDGVIIGRNCVIHPHVVIEAGVRIGDSVEIMPGAYLGRYPKGAGATARTPKIEGVVVIGDECSIGPNAVIYQDVTIGRNCLIADGASIREQCVIGDYCIISRYVTINYNTKIGSRTKVMDLTHLTGNSVIGNDVFISLTVGTVNDNAIGRLEYDDNRVRGQIIENGAAVGAGATLLPGIRIGAGSIVGAGSVVTKNVEPGVLVVGAPARMVRKIDEQ